MNKTALGFGVLLFFIGLILLIVAGSNKDNSDKGKKKTKNMNIAGGVLLSFGLLAMGGSFKMN